MPLLEEMITHLSPDECRRFRAYVSAPMLASKEMKLFEMISRNGPQPRDVLMKKLYGKQIKRNAYDNVRKRLIDRMIDFVVQDQAGVVMEPRAQVLRLMSAAYKFRTDQAWGAVRHFSIKAEEIALKYRMYTILEGIYDFMMQHATQFELDLSFEEIARKQQANAPRATRMRNLNEAATQMEIALHQAKRAGEKLDPTEIFDSVSQRFMLTSEERSNPTFRLRIVRMFRSALLSAKQYGEVYKLLMEAYTDFDLAKAFRERYSEEESAILYMVAHSLYRNRKFDEVSIWIDRLSSRMPSSTWITNTHYLKAQALRAAMYAYTRRNDEAIGLMSELRKHRPSFHHMKEWLNIDLSLSVYHFNAKAYRKAITILNQIHQLDINLADWMGTEWCFKMDMIELITHFEFGNEELAMQRHARIAKKYRSLLRHDKYANAALFFKIIGKILRNPDVVGTASFRTQVKTVVQNWEFDMGDLQAVTFFCWLKSKLHGKDYYELLLEEVKAGSN